MIIVQKERGRAKEETGAVQWRDKQGQWRNRGRGISGGSGETLMG
jgi:hypothetical protein